MIKTCIVEGCNLKQHTKGYCQKHYRKFIKYGNPLAGSSHEYHIGCKITNCNNKHFGKGFCNKHYKRMYKYGDPFKTKIEKHGMEGTSIYSTWQSMKKRCTNPNCKSYKNYGGRGIKVCDRWLHSFSAFYEDMGDKPFLKATLERKDNDGDYEPTNCSWKSRREQNQNKRNNIFNKKLVKQVRYLYERKNVSVGQLQKQFKVPYSSLYLVLHYKTWRNVI